MATKILARDDESVRNGSYYHVRTYKKSPPLVSMYILGDFHGYGFKPPAGLKEYTSAEVKKILANR